MKYERDKDDSTPCMWDGGSYMRRFELVEPTNVVHLNICYENIESAAFRLSERGCRVGNNSLPTRPRKFL